VFEHKTPTGRECYSYRNKLASLGVLQHEMIRHRNKALLVAIPALVLALGTALGFVLKNPARQVVGRMPEVVCIADRSFCIVGEIVVRAARPLGAVVRLSGINK